LTAAQPDVRDEDVAWATTTVAELRKSGYQLEHDVLPAGGDVPLVYAGLLSARDWFDEPFLAQHNREPFRYILDRGEQHGQQLHMTGLGGDEICGSPSQWLPELLRRHPRTAIPYLRAFAAMYRWSLFTVVRGVLNTPSYPAWMRDTAKILPNHEFDINRPDFGTWGSVPTMPKWISTDAVQLVREEMHQAAERNRTLAPDNGRHVLLASVHYGAQMARGFRFLAQAEGVPAAAPFFDDHVLNAAMSLRPADRVNLSRYKAILVEAMRGTVPDTTLERKTKSTTPMNAVLGSREHRDQIVGLTEDCQLARIGVVDLTKLRKYCRGPILVESYTERLEPTISCEVWLRDRVRETEISGTAATARRTA
jgi:asparagine synthase (glutamine-hydrolysing)